MITNDERFRLIFGLKLKQYRALKSLSLKDLADFTGLSQSYLNEIEKGKKYPKADKIAVIARGLGVGYDDLVSVKLTNDLLPLADLLESSLLQSIPLDLFGIDTSSMVDLISSDPAKFASFLRTLVKISRTFDVDIERFFFTALRSYQEMRKNYFEELEAAADDFRTVHSLPHQPSDVGQACRNLLQERYHYRIQTTDFHEYPELTGLRSIVIPSKNPALLINSSLSAAQVNFVLARELGFEALAIKERVLTSTWVSVESFEQVYGNFRASYFASALLIKRDALVADLREFFAQHTWSDENFLLLIEKYKATPEMFFYRLTQILPKFFGLDQMFFLRLDSPHASEELVMAKELHFSRLHSPFSNEKGEHYCRRWAASDALVKLSKRQVPKVKKTKALAVTNDVQIRVQRSHYYGTEHTYFVVSVAREQALSRGNSCVTIGIEINDSLRSVAKFIDDQALPTVIVNQTCERCEIVSCAERVSPAHIVNIGVENRKRIEAVEKITKDYIQK